MAARSLSNKRGFQDMAPGLLRSCALASICLHGAMVVHAARRDRDTASPAIGVHGEKQGGVGDVASRSENINGGVGKTVGYATMKPESLLHGVTASQETIAHTMRESTMGENLESLKANQLRLSREMAQNHHIAAILLGASAGLGALAAIIFMSARDQAREQNDQPAIIGTSPSTSMLYSQPDLRYNVSDCVLRSHIAVDEGTCPLRSQISFGTDVGPIDAPRETLAGGDDMGPAPSVPPAVNNAVSWAPTAQAIGPERLHEA